MSQRTFAIWLPCLAIPRLAESNLGLPGRGSPRRVECKIIIPQWHEIDALGPDELAARMAGKEPMVLLSNR